MTTLIERFNEVGSWFFQRRQTLAEKAEPAIEGVVLVLTILSWLLLLVPFVVAMVVTVGWIATVAFFFVWLVGIVAWLYREDMMDLHRLRADSL